MMRLEDLRPDMLVRGIGPGIVTVIQTSLIGASALKLTYKDSQGELRHEFYIETMKSVLLKLKKTMEF